MNEEKKIAYFSLEIAIESDIPTYSGGLGVLSGDMLRSAADLEVPMVAVALTYSGGYFYQVINHEGSQQERELRWEFTDEFTRSSKTTSIEVYGKPLKIQCWRYDIIGKTGSKVPLYLLDTDVEGNEDWMKSLTHMLYDSIRPEIRLIQEMILGIGGVRILDIHGLDNLETYHMNEGHAAFVTLELLKKLNNKGRVRDRCIFTTHTPVPTGFDVFSYALVMDVFREQLPKNIKELAGNDELNMAHLAANLSGYINAVSRKHAEVSKILFPEKKINYITNGINVVRWISPYLREIYETSMPGWDQRPEKLKNVFQLNSVALWTAHQKAKFDLLDYEKSHSHVLLDDKLLTIGWGRRITDYKRPTLIFKDLDRLGKMAKGKVQFLFAGKTHPRDDWGKQLIKDLHSASEYLWKEYKVRVSFLENYDMDLAKLMISGSDLWLNTPRCGMEASGTSGMKAALNGVPQLSSLDGWWIEAVAMEDKAGWYISAESKGSECVTDDDSDANDIYRLLEKEIIPIYYDRRNEWIDRMKLSIKLASHFNTHRMVRDYATNAWQLIYQPCWKSVKFKWAESIK
ncbi:MAG: alpha-glucan family phosphorylase [Candidatus Helarchaeota archaeon]|nr:alpha-glucan family phosphorylase [Candidatus Helarchaeota archaeon]